MRADANVYIIYYQKTYDDENHDHRAPSDR